jgi:hypothetical protein
MQKGIECLPLNTRIQPWKRNEIYQPVLSKVGAAAAAVVVVVNKNIRVMSHTNLSLSTKESQLIKIHNCYILFILLFYLLMQIFK